jgi:hypothetical protein
VDSRSRIESERDREKEGGPSGQLPRERMEKTEVENM